jgi:hypothetical protein
MAETKPKCLHLEALAWYAKFKPGASFLRRQCECGKWVGDVQKSYPLPKDFKTKPPTPKEGIL